MLAKSLSFLAGAEAAGVVVALMWARFSTKVLDEVSVAQMLGTTVVGAFPRNRALLDNPLAALKTTPRSEIVLLALGPCTLRRPAPLRPALSAYLDNTCYSCHGVMGQRQLALDRGAQIGRAHV